MPRGHNRTGRSRNPEGQYTPLSYRMTQSDAWRSLSGPAVKVLLELCNRYNGGNNGDLSLSLDDAAHLLGIGKSTAHRAFEELAEKGFIELVARGRWIRGEASTWRVTFLNNPRQQRTNDWREWKAPEKPPKKRRPWGGRKQDALEKFKRGMAAKKLSGPEAGRNHVDYGPQLDRGDAIGRQ